MSNLGNDEEQKGLNRFCKRRLASGNVPARIKQGHKMLSKPDFKSARSVSDFTDIFSGLASYS
jgi:hypothetical protein